MNSEICVPTTAVAAGGEDGAMVEPAAGDYVSVTLEGRVTRSGDGKVYFTAEKANGEDIPQETMAPEVAASPVDEDAGMDDYARKLQQET